MGGIHYLVFERVVVEVSVLRFLVAKFLWFQIQEAFHSEVIRVSHQELQEQF